MPEDDELFDNKTNKKQPETAKSSDYLHLAGVRILNSNLSLKIRIKEGSFRVLSRMVQNLNSKMAQAHLNSNLLQKPKQSTPKKERLKLKLINLIVKML